MIEKFEGKDLIIEEPHPDDAFLGLWGLFKDRGFKKSILVTLTHGELDWNSQKVSKEIKEIRDKETKCFIDKYNIPKHLQGDLGDGKIDPIKAKYLLETFISYNDLKNPILFCPSKEDLHPDHKATYWACVHVAPTIQYAINHPKSDGWATYSLNHNKWQDINKEVEFKNIYPSQYDLLKKNYPSMLINRFDNEKISTYYAREYSGAVLLEKVQ